MELVNDKPLLELSGVTFGYPGIVALREVNFGIKRGEFLGIIGPNGSGKSTLLKGVLGLLRPVEGKVLIFGTSYRNRDVRKKIGYVPQKSKSEASFPASVKEVVMMGLYSQIGWLHRPNQSHRRLVEESLERVGMADLAERPIGELSGGQYQKVMIARALVNNPELLILDEPTAAVDISAQRAILELLEKLNREQGMTVLMVSHDINEIVHFCDRILLLNGKVCAFGTPAEVLTKENLGSVYGARLFIYDHHGHPHIMVGDFDD
ncbi:MAG: metal ABC transporter ATP-binding protein [Firmicutes bacterium]|nr:metal ABC transporter ATP-binding protein [Bacillota bacterium]